VSATLPIEHFYDLSRLSDAGDEVVVAAKSKDLQALAQWLEVESVQEFEAIVTLTKLAAHRYRLDAALACDLTQASVVSLNPVRSRIKESFSRELHVAHRPRHAKAPELDPVVAYNDDDVPEELDSPQYNLAAPLLEELSLALDPYPKASGEVFEVAEDDGARIESPFAVLKGLKDRD
jgi:uncharacterized metal-binding protein YceD (DUF177 family)